MGFPKYNSYKACDEKNTDTLDKVLPYELWTLIFNILYEPNEVDLLNICLVCRTFKNVIMFNCNSQYKTQKTNQGYFKDMPCNLDDIKRLGICDYMGYSIDGLICENFITKDYSKLKMVMTSGLKIPSLYFDTEYIIKDISHLYPYYIGYGEPTPKRRMIKTKIDLYYGVDIYVQDYNSKNKYPMAWSKGNVWYTFINANVETIRFIICNHKNGPFKGSNRLRWFEIDTTSDIVHIDMFLTIKNKLICRHDFYSNKIYHWDLL